MPAENERLAARGRIESRPTKISQFHFPARGMWCAARGGNRLVVAVSQGEWPRAGVAISFLGGLNGVLLMRSHDSFSPERDEPSNRSKTQPQRGGMGGVKTG